MEMDRATLRKSTRTADGTTRRIDAASAATATATTTTADATYAADADRPAISQEVNPGQMV